ncbi:MAG: cell division protein ZapA [Prevotellaceae bacterium]|jgi:cell division protein ZapA (FtsZ GTPase activity inhibitor)|nr:cell division protein ZapA [Prevotellaceae bacterium]
METYDLLTINIKVAGNNFRIAIRGEEEESYRIAEQVLNKKLEHYEHKFANLQRNTIIAMAAYDMAVCFMRYAKSLDNTELLEDIKAIVDKEIGDMVD